MSKRIEDEKRLMASSIGLSPEYDFYQPVHYEEGERLARAFFVLSQKFSNDGVGLEDLRQAYEYMQKTTKYGDSGIPLYVSVPGYRVFAKLCEINGIKL